MPKSFGERLKAAVAEHSNLCVGVDPHAKILREWGLEDSASGLADFSMRCVEAFAGRVGVVKPQSAFFERHGAAGIAVLESMMSTFREVGTVVILDAKRGDLGSTMTGYAEAYLGESSPNRADALTVNPFLGCGSLDPAVEVAKASGAGLFALALTSNPEGSQVQHARDAEGRSVAAQVVDYMAGHNDVAPGEWGSFGVVVGATISPSAAASVGVDVQGFNGPLLVPGFGAQGATADDIRQVFGAASTRAIVNSSRGILAAGPDINDLRTAATESATSLRFNPK